MEMLGGEVDFSVDGLMRCFEAEFTLAFVNVNGLGGGGGGGAGALREPTDSNSNQINSNQIKIKRLDALLRIVTASGFQ